MEDLDLVDCDELQKCLSLAHTTSLTCTEEIHGTVKGYEQNIGPIQCVNMACVH